jgi:adenylate kinase
LIFQAKNCIIKNMQPLTLVFFGVQGSGKGTQIKLLIDLLKTQTGAECLYAYPGAEFRKLVGGDSFTSKFLKDSLDRGELQPDFLTNTVFANIFLASFSPEKHIIADGYPRTVAQSQNLEKIMDYYKRNNVKIINIELSREEAIKRNLKRGRDDDTEEGLAKRIQWHEDYAVPAMNYFKDKSGYEIFTINGEQPVEDVQKDIVKALNL